MPGERKSEAHMKPIFWVSLVFGSFLVVSFILYFSGSLGNGFSPEGIKSRSTPPGGTILSFSESPSTPSGREWVWRFKCPMGWSEFTEWAKRTLTQEYRLITSDSTHIFLSKNQPGDFFELRFERGESEPPIVNVSLKVRAD